MKTALSDLDHVIELCDKTSAPPTLAQMESESSKPAKTKRPQPVMLRIRQIRFQARVDLFKALGEQLSPPQDQLNPRIVVLYGPEGVGKSSLINEYAYRSLERYDTLLRTDCTSTCTY